MNRRRFLKAALGIGPALALGAQMAKAPKAAAAAARTGAEAHFFPDELYLALYTAMPTADADAVEVASVHGYSRVPIIAETIWRRESRHTVSNTEDITFPTATDDWGRVVGLALMHEPQGGEEFCLGSAALRNPKFIGAGDTVKFCGGGGERPGDLKITIPDLPEDNDGKL